MVRLLIIIFLSEINKMNYYKIRMMLIFFSFCSWFFYYALKNQGEYKTCNQLVFLAFAFVKRGSANVDRYQFAV
jgi:hypothetical protein